MLTSEECKKGQEQEMTRLLGQVNTLSVRWVTLRKSSMCQGLGTKVERTPLPRLHTGHKRDLPARPEEVWTLTFTGNKSKVLTPRAPLLMDTLSPHQEARLQSQQNNQAMQKCINSQLNK